MSAYEKIVVVSNSAANPGTLGGYYPVSITPRRYSAEGAPDEITRRYIASVANQMSGEGLNLRYQRVGLLDSLVGTGLPRKNRIVLTEMCACVAVLDEVTPGAVWGFRYDVETFLSWLETQGFGVRAGRGMLGPKFVPGSVAALVSHRVDPAAVAQLTNIAGPDNGVTVPAVVDLRHRLLHIPRNLPVPTMAACKETVLKAFTYLPHPQMVFG